MASIYPTVQSKRHDIVALAEQYGIRDIRVFGSVLRQEDDEGSDIDFLVSIEPTRSLIDLSRFRLDVQAMLGRECDVVSDRGLHPLLKDRILSEAESL